MNKIKIFGIEIDLLGPEELIKIIINNALTGNKIIIGHTNIKGLNLAYEQIKYRNFLKMCQWIYCDGVGVLLEAKFLGYKISLNQRLTCPDYLDNLLHEIVRNNLSIFFLAGEPGIPNKIQNILPKRFPTLKFIAEHGFFQKEGIENDNIIEKINSFKPGILFIGFGMPVQEYWIMNNFDRINSNVFLPLGACLDFYTGHTYRGPGFLTNYGFEWVSRLITQPKKLWRRYLVGNPLFFYRLIKQKLKISNKYL
jgi:N-acetylglucosaminyldiphosphoundecaprenol N-acetyl-beta-D-mannosaminyltransferase